MADDCFAIPTPRLSTNLEPLDHRARIACVGGEVQRMTFLEVWTIAAEAEGWYWRDNPKPAADAADELDFSE